MNIKEKYEAVIGLEVHAQLLTQTKAYSNDENTYGAAPNTKTSAITLGHPGTLPVSNKKVIEYAVKLGLSVGAKIRKHNEYARKNYFYADLPKGYQITQDTTPICNGGVIEILDEKNKTKKINITRIHMEEDAGKSIHDLDPFNTLIDLNRAGVPLLEIVSEPEIKTGDEAFNYVMEVRKLVRYLDICDGNMEEGSLRCDANISVRIRGESKFGTKVEVKNMNSSRNVKNAIDFEIKRQIEVIENGGQIVHETRGFDAVKGITISQRHKEEANDYRYFPEPDLQPIEITKEYIEQIKKTLPLLPKELNTIYQREYKLSQYDSNLLIEDKETALFFNEICALTNNYKLAANIINGVIKSYLNENGLTITQLDISAKNIANLIDLIEGNQISNTIATSKIFPLLISSKKSPKTIAEENNWIQESDNTILKDLILQALEKYPEKIQEYKNGKKGLIGLFMGEVMKISKGKADPKITNKLLRDILEK
jgi:aspartyl-tRNA(Asn)/glutamyl-tRNA(Gln) amidotransferase subunit B